ISCSRGWVNLKDVRLRGVQRRAAPIDERLVGQQHAGPNHVRRRDWARPDERRGTTAVLGSAIEETTSIGWVQLKGGQLRPVDARTADREGSAAFRNDGLWRAARFWNALNAVAPPVDVRVVLHDGPTGDPLRERSWRATALVDSVERGS